MTKILTGGALALVAVLAFTFGQNISFRQSDDAAAARIQIAPVSGTAKIQAKGEQERMITAAPKNSGAGSGGSGAVPAGVACSDPKACNYVKGALPGKGTKANPEICHYAFYAERNPKGDDKIPSAAEALRKMDPNKPEVFIPAKPAADGFDPGGLPGFIDQPPFMKLYLTTFTIKTPEGKIENESSFLLRTVAQRASFILGQKACKTDAQFN